MEILQGRQTTDNYPYGRLRCTRHTDLEFKKGKGYRVAHTTINPKTGRVNAPKRSTYSDFGFLYEEEGTGYTQFYQMRINGFESIAKFIDIVGELSKSGDLLERMTEDQNQDIYAKIIATIKVSTMYTKLREGVSVTDFLEATKVKEIIKAYGAKESLSTLREVGFDLLALNRLKA